MLDCVMGAAGGDEAGSSSQRAAGVGSAVWAGLRPRHWQLACMGPVDRDLQAYLGAGWTGWRCTPAT